ncbi:methyltransferase domain-containing protein [Legionella drancourtii]|uniref:methyltransferase domain-containing protein n=1 Tax=Legionella drancourtii TaxID=168933 RepID=UPI0038993FC3
MEHSQFGHDPELGVHHGIEPASAMRAIALSHGIEVLDGTAEFLPYQGCYFDFSLLINILCFLDDPEKTLHELY